MSDAPRKFTIQPICACAAIDYEETCAACEAQFEAERLKKELLSMSKFLDTMAGCDFSAHYKAGFRNAAALCRKAVKGNTN